MTTQDDKPGAIDHSDQPISIVPEARIRRKSAQSMAIVSPDGPLEQPAWEILDRTSSNDEDSIPPAATEISTEPPSYDFYTSSPQTDMTPMRSEGEDLPDSMDLNVEVFDEEQNPEQTASTTSQNEWWVRTPDIQSSNPPSPKTGEITVELQTHPEGTLSLEALEQPSSKDPETLPRISAPPPFPPSRVESSKPLSAPPRKSRNPPPRWWEQFFEEHYLRTTKIADPKTIIKQCDFIESELQLAPGSRVLDVGCGLGLHAAELSSRGHQVVGIDLSLNLLTRASDEARGRGQRIRFLHGDLRNLEIDSVFDGVYCIGTSFGFFDDKGNQEMLAKMVKALGPEGFLMLETVNRDFVVKSQPTFSWYEGNNAICMEETDIDPMTSRLVVSRTAMPTNGGDQFQCEYAIRLYSSHELHEMMKKNALKPLRLSGQEATPGVFFGADSPKLIITAEHADFHSEDTRHDHRKLSVLPDKP